MSNEQIVRCECGYEVIEASESALVEAVRAHARSAHGIVFSAEEALLVVFRSQLDGSRQAPPQADARTSRVSSNQGGET